MLLTGKTAVISGAASPRGIGLCTARLFAEHGARVAILDLSDGASRHAAGSLSGEGHLGLACDVTDKAACAAAAVLDVSLRGTLDLGQACIPSMRARGGSIVCMSSVSAQRDGGIRRHASRRGEVQGQGCVGQALGVADVLAVSYVHALRFRADDPARDGRGRFLLSIDHYAIALHAALIDAGILSDGELDEGSTWDAAMGAAHRRLDNLVAVVDVNDQVLDRYDCSFKLGRAAPLREGADVLVISAGFMTMRALDEAAVLREAGRSGRLVVVAGNHSVVGGLGEAVASLLVRHRVSPAFEPVALPDAFLAAGALPTLHDRYGPSSGAMAASVERWLGE